MKAVVCHAFGDIDNLSYEECAPPALLPNQVRVAVHSASLGFADVLMAKGLYQLKPPLPYSPGACGAGVVTEIGREVTSIAVGDRVSFLNFFGALTEEIATFDHTIVKLPAATSFEQAAAYRLTYGPAYFALKVRAKLQAGETLLVTGAGGGIGMAAVRLGKTMGATVIAAVGSEAKIAAVRNAGADHVIDYSKVRLRDAVKELTSNAGADVIFEVVGGNIAMECIRCINVFGRLIVMGFAGGTIQNIPANLPLLKNCSIVGVNFGGWSIHKNIKAVSVMNDELLALAIEGKLDSVIAHRFPLSESVVAMKTLLEHKAAGKIVVSVR